MSNPKGPERDSLRDRLQDYEGRRWYSAEMMDAVVRERDQLKAEVERLREELRWLKR